MSSSLVDDPTVRAPGFHLRRRQWSLLNRFRTGQGHCGTCRKKWGLADSEMCDCGRHPDNVAHRRHCRRGRCRLADVIWHTEAFRDKNNSISLQKTLMGNTGRGLTFPQKKQMKSDLYKAAFAH